MNAAAGRSRSASGQGRADRAAWHPVCVHAAASAGRRSSGSQAGGAAATRGALTQDLGAGSADGDNLSTSERAAWAARLAARRRRGVAGRERKVVLEHAVGARRAVGARGPGGASRADGALQDSCMGEAASAPAVRVAPTAPLAPKLRGPMHQICSRCSTGRPHSPPGCPARPGCPALPALPARHAGPWGPPRLQAVCRWCRWA